MLATSKVLPCRKPTSTTPRAIFPLFYLHDGQNLFRRPRPLTSPTHHLAGPHHRRPPSPGEEASSELRPSSSASTTPAFAGCPKYTPTRDPGLRGGDGDLYGRLLLEATEALHRSRRVSAPPCPTPPTPGSAADSSPRRPYLALYLGFTPPEVFSRLARNLSPSVWWSTNAPASSAL